jgi:hypothetical protein
LIWNRLGHVTADGETVGTMASHWSVIAATEKFSRTRCSAARAIGAISRR